MNFEFLIINGGIFMVRTVGFPLNYKQNEYRQALTFRDVKTMQNKDHLYFEHGYGKSFGVTDKELLSIGVQLVDRKDVLTQDIICDPKAGDAEYIAQLQKGQIIFGWIHAVQNELLTETLISRQLTAIAWEDMNEAGRHVFWRNNEIAGESAIMHAFTCYGKMPYDTRVAILGRGNVARGATRILVGLGAQVSVYDRRTEELLSKELGKFDVIVNAITWDTTRTDHIIYKKDLERMKHDAFIIDISCDEAMAIETSKPTTVDNPTYFVDGILHYAVDHTPSLFYKTATDTISREVIKYLPFIMNSQETTDQVLKPAVIIEKGKIRDKKIIKQQLQLS